MKDSTLAESAAGDTTETERSPSLKEFPVLGRYLIAVLSILVAFAIRFSLTPLLGEELPFMLFIAAALVAAWCGGAIAGIASLLLGLFLADYFFLSRGRVNLSQPMEMLYILRYLFTASLGIVLIEVLHRNRRRTQAAVEELQREVARRTQSERALFKAQAQLSRHAGELEARVVERTVKLDATVKALQGLLYHIAHNLRAPLRAVQGYTKILMEEYGSRLDAPAQDYSRHLCDAAGRMDQLIMDLLEYGRLEYVEPRFATVPLDEILERVLFRLAYEIKSTRATVSVAAPLPEVSADPELLEQVLSNLLENALKFVPPGTRPQVAVRAELRDRDVRLWVEDNGVGIEPQYHQRIFGVFETLYPSRGDAGTGIGLAIVKQAMQRLGGQVGLESQTGAGSRFWIELARPSQETASTPPADGPRNGSGGLPRADGVETRTGTGVTFG